MLYEMIDMSEWRTKEDILSELKIKGLEMSERTFRQTVEKHNKLFYNHEIDVFVAHSLKGYKATTDEDEIRMSAYYYRKRALDQLTKYARICKAIGENANMKLELDDEHIIVC